MKAIVELFTGKPFDFYTPYTLDEVYQRLDLTERDFIKHPEQYDLIKFRRKWLFVNATLHEESSGVRVVGRVNLGYFLMFVQIIWLAITVLAILVALSSSADVDNNVILMLPIVVVFATVMFLFQIAYQQHELYQMIQNKLSKPKRKKR